jgi:hypothetical protein
MLDRWLVIGEFDADITHAIEDVPVRFRDLSVELRRDLIGETTLVKRFIVG